MSYAYPLARLHEPYVSSYFEDIYFRSEYEGLAVTPDRRGPKGSTFDLWNYTTWLCDRKNGIPYDLTEFGIPGFVWSAQNMASQSYFAIMLGKPLRLTIKRTNDGSHPAKAWKGRPVIKGFLPAEWALLRNLEYLDLSDDMGQGLIEGPIPSTWLMMTRLRTINLTGHPNFCKDWHRIVAYFTDQYGIRLRNRFAVDGVYYGREKSYYGRPFYLYLNGRWRLYYHTNVTLFNLDGVGWQWYDPRTGEGGIPLPDNYEVGWGERIRVPLSQGRAGNCLQGKGGRW
ncbi:hypothetical protein VOLCADRAFT_95844 [Volvox carteri f. nagariensis]|uniref:Uncharacterized protein n=1 Tax=Volvox carteri f. nagariensis TaxID=3068 RepID=D8U8I8_VOLCA|nr:uncharacterized protein VOLCADRAFT_95844 [Volvox carteri f. nagariensis]EFJ43988.1 hypothetical protein VOLCADRAFT_95844 [Volvox carteri f. nagariensis]|eukprot:XP_002955000.1 hypothetical protein VOLCADRAFT_95844 [Volvox carteri f. nagariensis]